MASAGPIAAEELNTPIFCHLPYNQLFGQKMTILLVQGGRARGEGRCCRLPGTPGGLYQYPSIPPQGTSRVQVVYLPALLFLVVVSASLSDARVRLADLRFPQILPGLVEVAIALLLPVL